MSECANKVEHDDLFPYEHPKKIHSFALSETSKQADCVRDLLRLHLPTRSEFLQWVFDDLDRFTSTLDFCFGRVLICFPEDSFLLALANKQEFGNFCSKENCNDTTTTLCFLKKLCSNALFLMSTVPSRLGGRFIGAHAGFSQDQVNLKGQVGPRSPLHSPWEDLCLEPKNNAKKCMQMTLSESYVSEFAQENPDCYFLMPIFENNHLCFLPLRKEALYRHSGAPSYAKSCPCEISSAVDGVFNILLPTVTRVHGDTIHMKWTVVATDISTITPRLPNTPVVTKT